MKVRENEPAIQRIRSARRNAQRVAPILKRLLLHSSAKMAAPEAMASRSFKRVNIGKTLCGYPIRASDDLPSQIVPLLPRALDFVPQDATLANAWHP